LKIDENKPGFYFFDLNWTRQGVIVTFQIKRIPKDGKAKDKWYIRKDDTEDFSYEVHKEEFPD
jgi:hypothetical protein